MPANTKTANPPSIPYLKLLCICLLLLTGYTAEIEPPGVVTSPDPTPSPTPSPVPSQQSIYGVRWFLGDRFAYSHQKLAQDQASQHRASHNHYILAFNSDTELAGEPYLWIGQAAHACTHKHLSIENVFTRDPIEIEGNDTRSESHFYRCNVNMDPRRLTENTTENTTDIWEEVPYRIYTETNQFQIRVTTKEDEKKQTLKDRRINHTQNVLFQGKFRVPVPNRLIPQSTDAKLKDNQRIRQNILVFGDIGEINQQSQQQKHYTPILESVLAKLQQDPSIVLTIFLGDLAYDYIGHRFTSILRYLQPLTSRVCFMNTPGNHDYVYHQDSFTLYYNTFLTPEWNKYFNFYYNFVLGDVLFLSYSPDNLISAQDLVRINIRPIQYLTQQFYSNGSLTDPISQQLHVVVFSHYPVFCSKHDDTYRTCQVSRTRLRDSLQVFQDLGMDLYLSGHVHYYERTHEICWSIPDGNYTLGREKDRRQTQMEGNFVDEAVYGGDCPIYAVEGVAGNNYFEDEEGTIQESDFTGKIVFNTGFGVLTLKTKAMDSLAAALNLSQPDSLEYTHYKMLGINRTRVTDRFIKKLPRLAKYAVQSQSYTYIDSDSAQVRISEMIGILAFVVLGSGLCYLYGRLYVGNFGYRKQKRHSGQHVEMVEEDFNVGPVSASQQIKKQNSDNSKANDFNAEGL